MSIDPLEVISLGTFIQYATPAPVSFQFLDGDGNGEDMSVGTWTGEIEGEQLHVSAQPSGIYGNVPTVNASTSTIRYVFDPEDFDFVGRFRFILYAGNGTTRLAAVFEYIVKAVYGSEPTN